MRIDTYFDCSRHTLFGIALICAFGLTGCNGDTSQSLLTQAQASLKAGDQKAAVIQLKGAIQKDERNAEARFQLAQIQLEQGDYASAEKELRRARDAGKPAEIVNPLLARSLMRLGEYQRVLDDIPLPGEGSSIEATYLVARANAQLGLKEVGEARKSLERAMAVAPNDAEVHLAWARMSVLDGKVDEAFQQIDAAIKAVPDNLEAWLLKGDLLRASGKLKEAEATYQHALKLDPKHQGTRLALAGIAITENRLADARVQVGTVLKAHPNSLLAHYIHALIDFREKKYTVARDHLAKVLSAAPNYSPALLLNGSVEYALGNLQTAETHLKKVVKVGADNVYALRLLAATQLRLGRAEDASNTLAPALKLAPEDAGVRIVAGEIALHKKAYSEAASHFEAAAAANPKSAAIRTELGLSRLAQGDSRALTDLQTAAGMEGGDSRPDTFIILTQLKAKQFDAALASIESLEKKQPASPLNWNYRGAAYLGKQNRPQARASFTQALKLDPAFFPAAANLAQMDLQDKQPAQARKRFEDILKVQPMHLNAMLALAELGRLGKDEKAYLNWLEKAASSNPKAIEPKILLGRHLLGKGDNAKATAIAREAVNIDSKNLSALDLLGSTLMANNDNEGALGTYQTLANLYPTQPEPRLKLAQIQIAMKQVEDARDSLQQALKLDPNHSDAQFALGELDIQAARYDSALAIAKRLQQQHPRSPTGPVLEGDTASARKQYAAAIDAFQRAHKLAPSLITLVRLDRALASAGRGQESVGLVSAWVANHPQDPSARLYLAERLTSTGQFKLAANHYLYLNQQSPGNLVVLNNLAWTLAEIKDKRALSFAEQALKLKPDNSAVMDTLGWLLVQQGDTERGVKLLQQALSRAPNAGEIQYHLAAAFVKAGEPERARGELKRLLASGVAFPQVQEARVLLARLDAGSR